VSCNFVGSSWLLIGCALWDSELKAGTQLQSADATARDGVSYVLQKLWIGS
jgi:hypothetical protein